jgi:ferric enterobactin receptor
MAIMTFLETFYMHCRTLSGRMALIALISFIFASVGFAQHRPMSGGSGSAGPRMIAGELEDSEAQIPIPGANIMLFADGVLIEGETVDNDASLRGTATDDGGRFRIMPVPEGTYDLLIRALGYEQVLIENIEINSSSPRVDLGKLNLNSTALEMEEVELRVEGTDVTLAPDRKIYRISSSVADAGGTVSDALEEIPSVTVDLEGNVSLRGNSNVRILIDGKPSTRIGLNPGEALQQLSAELVDRVEVMTNPSAKYDAQGDAGIINIVLKRDRSNGLNGSVNVSGGYPESYGVGFNLNYRTSKINYFINEQIRNRSHEGGGTTDQEYFDPTAPFKTLDQDEEFDRSGWNNFVRFGFEYFLTNEHTITISGFNQYNESETEGQVRYRYFDQAGLLVSDILRVNPEDETGRYNGGDFGYRWAIDDKGHEFTADYQFEKGSESELSVITEEWLVGLGNAESEIVDNIEGESRHLIQMDYVLPLGSEHKLEAGAKSSMRELDHDYEVVESGTGATVDISNHLIYQENIHAGYFTWSNRLNDHWSYQTGLRAEYSDVSTELIADNDLNERDYFDLFPSAFLTYDLSLVNSIQASYSRRLQRPHHWFLIPFWNYTDSRNIRQGNPNLDPEYSNSFEIGHLWHTEKGSVNTSAYYRQATGVIEWVERAEGDIIVARPYNIGDRDSYGFEFVVMRQMASWINLQGSVNVYNASSSGEFEGISYDRDYLSWFTRLSSRVSFTKTTQMQTRLFYMGPRETIQGERAAMYAMDFGLSQSLWDNNVTVSFNVRDLFDTRKRRMETTTDSFYSDSEFQWRGRTFRLQLTWRFNQDERQKRQGSGMEMNGGFDDEGGF